MQAVTIADGNIEVTERPDPEPGKGEILVSVRAAGLNGADMIQRKGHYPAPPGSPADIPGLELAGVVVGLGDGAARFEEGGLAARIAHALASKERVPEQRRNLQSEAALAPDRRLRER